MTAALSGSPAAVEAGAVTENGIVRKVAWRLMPLIMVCYLFAFFDRINISFAKFQLQGELGFSNTAYGLGASLFVIGYVIFEVPSNLLLYRVGARRWIARIMISWGIATALMVFVHTRVAVLRAALHHRRDGGGLRAGHAVLPDAVVPGLSRPRDVAAVPRLGVLGPLRRAARGPDPRRAERRLGLAGWHWLFLIGGLPCLVWACWCCAPRRPDRRRRWLTAAGEGVPVRAASPTSNREIGDHSLWGRSGSRAS